MGYEFAIAPWCTIQSLTTCCQQVVVARELDAGPAAAVPTPTAKRADAAASAASTSLAVGRLSLVCIPILCSDTSQAKPHVYGIPASLPDSGVLTVMPL